MFICIILPQVLTLCFFFLLAFVIGWHSSQTPYLYRILDFVVMWCIPRQSLYIINNWESESAFNLDTNSLSNSTHSIESSISQLTKILKNIMNHGFGSFCVFAFNTQWCHKQFAIKIIVTWRLSDQWNFTLLLWRFGWRKKKPLSYVCNQPPFCILVLFFLCQNYTKSAIFWASKSIFNWKVWAKWTKKNAFLGTFMLYFGWI